MILKKGVSIVICTYNGKLLLPKTFEYLSKQKLNIPCEIIFVDNASTDGTKIFADTWWSSHKNKNIIYKSYSQPIPGKSYAQDLGYEKANYEYLLVCDDDNWLCDTYVQTTFEIMESNPNIGALGGWCEAVFEKEKPKWFDSYSKFFAVAKQGDINGDITDKKGCLYGAGMVIRKSHWLELKNLGFEHLLSCRKGNSLSSGGDTEYSYVLRLLGYKIWFDERLYFQHFMTDNRMNLKYVSKLRKAMSYSNFVLSIYLDLLDNKHRSYYNFLSRAMIGFPLQPIKKIRLCLVGSYVQKEQSKLYLRNLKYLLFDYKTYHDSRKFVEGWLLKRKN